MGPRLRRCACVRGMLSVAVTLYVVGGEGAAGTRGEPEAGSDLEVRDLFEVQKEEIGGDILRMQAEIQAIVEETKAEAQAAVEEAG